MGRWAAKNPEKKIPRELRCIRVAGLTGILIMVNDYNGIALILAYFLPFEFFLIKA